MVIPRRMCYSFNAFLSLDLGTSCVPAVGYAGPPSISVLSLPTSLIVRTYLSIFLTYLLCQYRFWRGNCGVDSVAEGTGTSLSQHLKLTKRSPWLKFPEAALRHFGGSYEQQQHRLPTTRLPVYLSIPQLPQPRITCPPFHDDRSPSVRRPRQVAVRICNRGT